MMEVVGWGGMKGNFMQGREHKRERDSDRKEKQILAMLTHFYGSLTNNIIDSDSNNYNRMV